MAPCKRPQERELLPGYYPALWFSSHNNLRLTGTNLPEVTWPGQARKGAHPDLCSFSCQASFTKGMGLSLPPSDLND